MENKKSKTKIILLITIDIIFMKFSIRIEDLELRSCGEHLLTEGVEHTRAEIVQWENEEYCWTLAYWNKNSNGYNLEFVGNRPFDTNQ